MILIIDDQKDSKVGDFETILNKAGFPTECADTLEKAIELFKAKQDVIDAIILDYAFPVSQEDDRVCDTNGKPNGIVFLENFKFQIRLKSTPIIINTNADEEYRKLWLRAVNASNLKIIYESDGNQSLADISKNPIAVKEIINEITMIKEQRKITRENEAHAKDTTAKWPKWLVDRYRD